MRFLKFGKHALPAWLISVIIVSTFSAAFAAYDLSTLFNVPLQVKAPITLVNYPSQFSLYPGEAENFTVTVSNQAPVNYSAILSFQLNDSAYQASYVTFSKTVYEIVSGQQDLQAWLSVSSAAPPANVMVSIDIVRIGNSTVAPPDSGNYPVNGDFETGDFSGWNVGGVCSISSTIVHSGSYSAYISDAVYDSSINQYIGLSTNYDWQLQGWVYPLNVGSLGQAQYPLSCLQLQFYNKSTMSPAFSIYYEWCWNDFVVSNTTTQLIFLLTFNKATWNYLSRNVARDIQSVSYYASTNISELVLYNIKALYHFSMGSPGAFYVDDLQLLQPTT
jgi:hypothetical protein